ncbi:MAG: hypothetical protein JST09_05385 [Bacteroidetes bacterium]|nr:hypothetical protein [Bacteroidota bacterium]
MVFHQCHSVDCRHILKYLPARSVRCAQWKVLFEPDRPESSPDFW